MIAPGSPGSPGSPPGSRPGSQAADEGLTTLDLVPGVVSLFAHQSVTVVVWHATPNPAIVERLGQVSERRRKLHPEGVSVVHLIQGQFDLPDTPTREAFARVVREGEGKLAAVGILIAGSGFWVSALRSLVTGIRVLSRGSFDLGLHGTVDELCKWLIVKHAARTGNELSSDQLERALTYATRFKQAL